MDSNLGPPIDHLYGALARKDPAVPRGHLRKVRCVDGEEFGDGSITLGPHAMAGSTIIHEIPAPRIRRNRRGSRPRRRRKNKHHCSNSANKRPL